MTKRVRIEDADTSSYKVVVQVWNKSLDPNVPDIMEREVPFYGPSDLREFYIHRNNYLIVKEAE